MSLKERTQRFSDDISLLAEGEINPAQLGLRLAGETAGVAGDAIGAVTSAVMPDFVEEGIAHVVQGVMETGPAKAALAWMEKNPEHARDIVSALNVASLLPGGAVTKLGKGKRTYNDKALRGNTIASQSNYIDNWYAPERPLTAPERALAKPVSGVLAAAERVPKGPLRALKAAGDAAGDRAVDAATLKATSLPIHGSKGLLDAARDTFSPSARALYGETGISAGSQRHVANELGKHHQMYPDFSGNPAKYNRAGEKGVAQVIYNNHIANQRGRVGDVHPVMKEVTDRAFIEDYQPMTPESMSEMFQRQTYQVDRGFKGRDKKLDTTDPLWREMPEETIDPKDAEFATRYIFQKQKPGKNASMVMKAPANIESGGHFNDVVYNNPANAAIADIFKKQANDLGEVDVETLYHQLEKMAPAANEKLKKAGRIRDGWSVVNSNLDHVRENGLWLAGGRGGSAVTEGGVMWLTKLEPNGNTTTFMVDAHDFMEGATSGLLNDLIAVSPPLKGNIKTQRKIKMKDGRVLKADDYYKQTKNRKDWKGEQPTREGGLLEQFINVRPSAQNVRAEQLVLGGRAGSLAGLGAASGATDE